LNRGIRKEKKKGEIAAERNKIVRGRGFTKNRLTDLTSHRRRLTPSEGSWPRGRSRKKDRGVLRGGSDGPGKAQVVLRMLCLQGVSFGQGDG